MNTIIYKAGILLSCLALVGCGATVRTSKYMSIEQPTLTHKPKQGHALIIFERANKHKGEYGTVSIWDTSANESPEIIALLRCTMKAAHQVTPGEHYFMLHVSGAYSLLMKATVDEGKTYYAMVDASHWILDKTFTEKMTPDNISVMNKSGLEWANLPDTRKSIESKVLKAQKKWDKLSEKKKAERTIVPADGR